MAAMTDPGMPGDDLPPQPDQSDLLNAYGAGYTHEDIAQTYGADPPRPDIGEIWGGTHPADATWTDAASASDNLDPYKLDTAEQARAQIDQLAESGAGIGAIESAGASVVKGLLGGRAAQLGVTTSTEGLTTVKSATEDVSSLLGNKWVKRGAAGFAGASTMRLFQGLTNDPEQWDKDFASQASMVNKGLTDEQNRKNK